jgi:UDP-N-acetylmuramoylalanine-D-glutamate ligase
LKPAFKNTLSDNHIHFEEGQHTIDEILSADEIIISPGIPEKNEVVKKIKAKNISLISDIEFAVRYTSAKIIAITGSNGKTLTLCWIQQRNRAVSTILCYWTTLCVGNPLQGIRELVQECWRQIITGPS